MFIQIHTEANRIFWALTHVEVSRFRSISLRCELLIDDIRQQWL